MKLKVYIAGPYSEGDEEANVRNAILMWHTLHNAGFVPFCPHLSHHIHQVKPLSYENWMTYDITWLLLCDVVLRLPGRSPGADREEIVAHRNGIPVAHSIHELVQLASEENERPP